MVFVRYPGHYKSDPKVKSTMLQGVCEYAVHLTRIGASIEVSHAMVDYRPQGYVATRHAGWTNVIDNLQRHTPTERVMKPDGQALRNEQKSRAMLMELISRFTKPSDIVVDLFGGTFSTATACLELPQPRKFMGCEMDEEAYELGRRQSVIPVLIRRILDESISSTAPVRVKASFLKDHRRMVQPYREHDPAWRPPSGLPAFQTLPSHMLRFLSITSGFSKISEDAGGVPVSSWSALALAHVQGTDPSVLLALDCVEYGLMVRKSLIKHPSSGRGVFASKPIYQGNTIAYYYGALVYTNLSTRPQYSKLYGLGGMMGVDVKGFRQKAVRCKGPEHDTGGDEWPATYYIVPAPFCAAGFINDAKYMDGDEEMEKKEVPGSCRTNNAKLRMRTSARTIRDIAKYTVCYVVATRDIKIGEEIYMDYRRQY